MFLIFLTLKILVNADVLHGNFEWLTWFWVFFPLWIGWAVSIAAVLLILIVAFVVAIVKKSITKLKKDQNAALAQR